MMTVPVTRSEGSRFEDLVFNAYVEVCTNNNSNLRRLAQFLLLKNEDQDGLEEYKKIVMPIIPGGTPENASTPCKRRCHTSTMSSYG